VTEEEVSPRAGQRPGKLALYGLARFVPNDNFCHWTGDEEKKVKQRNGLHCLGGKWPFVFLPLWLLNIDAKKWSVARRLRPINP
jgi:hypothetical protein